RESVGLRHADESRSVRVAWVEWHVNTCLRPASGSDGCHHIGRLDADDEAGSPFQIVEDALEAALSKRSVELICRHAIRVVGQLHQGYRCVTKRLVVAKLPAAGAKVIEVIALAALRQAPAPESKPVAVPSLRQH